MSSPVAQSSRDPVASAPNGEHENKNEPDIDAEMEDQTQGDTSATAQNTSSATLDNEMSSTQQQSDANAPGGGVAAQMQNRKDATLREFLSKMDDYAPIIPDAVTAHYLTLSGLPPPSPHDPTGVSTNTTPLPLARLLALATQKFIADLASDAYQFSRIRASNTASANNPLATTGVLPGQAGVAGAGGSGGGGGGGAAGKGANATQLGVQRSGYGGGGQGGSGQGRTVLTMEDLGMAVQEYGMNVKRGEFYR